MEEQGSAVQHKVVLIANYGTELNVVNAARVSFGVEKKVFGKADEGLLNFLITHRHVSPLRHVFVSVHVTTDRATTHQFYKHIVGAEFMPVKDSGFNQLSQRYKKCEEFLVIGEGDWRAQSTDNKQCSAGLLPDDVQKKATVIYNDLIKRASEAHDELIALGVAKEQARFVTPMSSMTQFIWSASLQAVLHFITLRKADDAQYEIRLLATKLDDIVRKEFPTIHRFYKEHPEQF